VACIFWSVFFRGLYRLVRVFRGPCPSEACVGGSSRRPRHEHPTGHRLPRGV